jgi:predicted MFS family arabinose efflux permease
VPLILLLSISIHACYTGSKVVVSLLALDLGASPMVVGTLAAFNALAPMFLAVYAGRLADRIGMRTPLLIGSICTAVAMVCGYLWQQLPGLFATATLMGVAFAFHNVSIQNLTGSYGRPEHRARNFSTLTISYSFSTFLGSMMAGFSIEYGGHGRAFLPFALLTALPIAILIFYPQFTRVPNQSLDKQERRALDLLRDPPLRRFIVMSGLMTAAYELYGFYIPIHAHAAGLSASTIGLILGTYGIATFISRVLLPFLTRRMPADEVMFWFMLLSAFGFLVLPIFKTFHLLALASFLIGIGSGLGPPVLMMLSFNRSPPGRTGEVTGLRLTVNNVSRVVMPLISGTLGTVLGSAPVFLMNAVILATISWLSRR